MSGCPAQRIDRTDMIRNRAIQPLGGRGRRIRRTGKPSNRTRRKDQPPARGDQPQPRQRQRIRRRDRPPAHRDKPEPRQRQRISRRDRPPAHRDKPEPRQRQRIRRRDKISDRCIEIRSQNEDPSYYSSASSTWSHDSHEDGHSRSRLGRTSVVRAGNDCHWSDSSPRTSKAFCLVTRALIE
jgi:hypothetical protein